MMIAAIKIMMAIISIAAVFAGSASAYADDDDDRALCASYIERAMDELKSVEKYLLKDEILEAETRLKQADVLLKDAVKQCPYAEAKASINNLAKVSEIFHARILCSLNVDKAIEEEKAAIAYLENQKKTEGVRLLRESARHLTIAIDKCIEKDAEAARKLLQQITGVIRQYEH